MAGHLKLAAHLLSSKIKHENFGFNQLHMDVLTLDKLTDKIHTASITKKA